MKRRSFLKGAAALFAAIAGTGPKLLDDGRTVAYVAFTPLREAEWLKKAYYIGWDPDAQTVARWRAERKLRIANHMIETATGATRLLAKGTHPALMIAYAAEMRARLADIQRQPPPWVKRRSVTIGPPQFQ